MLRNLSQPVFAALLATAMVSLGLASTAQAGMVSIDFVDGAYSTVGTPNDPGGLGYFDTYTEDGFQFQVPGGNHVDGVFTGTPTPNGLLQWHEVGDNTSNNVITLSFGGAAFDLVSVTLDPNHDFGSNVVTVSSSAGTTDIGGASGLYNLNYLNVTSVTFDNVDDNSGFLSYLSQVVVNVDMAAVPEPSSMALLLTGAIGLAGYGWRRKRRAA